MGRHNIKSETKLSLHSAVCMAVAVTALLGFASQVRGDVIPLGLAKTTETTETNKWDRWHDSTYAFLQKQVERADGWFVAEGTERQPVPPSQFRLGMFAETTVGVKNDLKIAPLVDFETEVSLPNAEHRMKVFVSTIDPTALPGTDAFEKDNAIRVGASRDWRDEIHFSAGVKVRWLPEVYALANWAPTYQAGDWQLYPQQKIFAETKDGIGGLTSFVADHWKNRWDFRQSASVKFSTRDADDDQATAADVLSEQYGEDGRGWRWECTTIFGYAKELLKESDLGRRINGGDLADGFGIRLTFNGNAEEASDARVTLFRKAPLRGKWLYYVIAPEIKWSDENNWGRELILKAGVEALFWGTPER